MKTLIIKPTEPLSLTATPITGYELFSYISTFSIPLPTTVIGAIGAALNARLISKDPVEGLKELIAIVKDKLKCEDPVIIGPLVFFKVDGEIKGPTIPILNRLFVYPKNIMKTITGYCIECDECFECEPLVKVGIALGRRRPGEEKLVRKGYMYKYPLAVYKERRSGNIAEPLFVYTLNCEKTLDKVVIRVGGENRVANIYVTEEKYFTEPSSKLTSPLKTPREGVYIATSPIPLLSSKNEQLYLDDVLGLEFINGVKGVLGIPQEKGKPPKIVTERLGLGFYEVTRTRRPQILALPQGTIIEIKIKIHLPALPDILKPLYTIGFASLYPIKSP